MMIFEQSVIVPYIVGSALSIGIAATKVRGHTAAEVLAILTIAAVGSWIYAGAYIAEMLNKIDKKLNKDIGR